MRPFTPACGLALLLVTGACGGDDGAVPATGDHGHAHAEGGDHGHSHGPAGEAGDHALGHTTLSVTTWGDGLELFAEHPPAIANHSMVVLAHFTVLEGFQPLEGATVQLALEGPALAESAVVAAVRPGIYELELVAPGPGRYTSRYFIEGEGLYAIVDGPPMVVHEEGATELAQEPRREGDIRLLKEQQWRLPFATAFAAVDSVMPTIEAPGEITAPPTGMAWLGAPVAGRVEAGPDGMPLPGQRVREGQLLLRIAPAPANPEDAARAELGVVEASARVAAAEAALGRAQRLLADRAIPRREFDDAERELAVAREALVAARRAHELFTGGRSAASLELRSPIGGIVAALRCQRGQAVPAGEQLLQVLDPGKLWVQANVAEHLAPRLGTEPPAWLRLPGDDEWLALAGASRLVHLGRVVDPTTRSVELVYELDDPDSRLRFGGLVTVAVGTGDSFGGVVLPRSAVLEQDGQSFAYVQLTGESFEERLVVVAARAGDRVGIRSGVEPGERVVTRGANLVRLAAGGNDAASHGHLH